MRVLYQPAITPIGDWLEVDAADWGALLADPVNAVNIQGVIFEGDHYAVEPITDGLRLYCWNDDPGDFTPDQYHGAVWEFLLLAPDDRFQGRFNTRQTCISYVAVAFPRIEASENETLALWSDFVAPSADITREGIWLADDVYQDSVDIRSLHGWREWTEDVPIEKIVAGRVVG